MAKHARTAVAPRLVGRASLLRARAMPAALLTVAMFLCDLAFAEDAQNRNARPFLPTFEANVGQWNDDYVARVFSAAGDAYLKRSGSIVMGAARGQSRSPQPLQHKVGTVGPPEVEMAQLSPTLELQNASARPEVLLEVRARATSNYFIGNDSAQWKTGVPHYRQVRYRNVYPDIDQVVHAAAGQLEFDFVVRPGGTPRDIRLASKNGEASLASDGDIHLGSGAATVTLKRPVAYQDVNGTRVPIASTFTLGMDGTIGFEVAAYDMSRDLVVDPLIDYSTLIGGSPITGMVVDDIGAVYLTGTTSSSVLPGGLSDLDESDIPADLSGTSYQSSANIFVAKLSPDGGEIEYLAILGSRTKDRGAGIAVNAKHQAIVTGVVQGPDYPMVKPVRNDPHSLTVPATYNVVTKLAASGQSIEYSYYHSRRTDTAFESTQLDPLVAVDAEGRTILAGVGDLPGAQRPQPPPSDPSYQCGATFVSRMLADDSAEDRALCLGATTVHGMTLGPAGMVYLTGSAASEFFGKGSVSTIIVNPTSFDTGVWATKIDVENARVIYHATLAGGLSGRDTGSSIASDEAGNAYLVGRTTSPLFPLVNARESGLTTRKLPIGQYYGAAFVTKLNAEGNQVLYSTFLNLERNPDFRPFATSLFVDEKHRAIISGDFTNRWSSTDGVEYSNAFVAKLSDQGDAVLSWIRVGGRALEFQTLIAPGRLHEIYIAGTTLSPDFPLVSAVQGWNGGLLASGSYLDHVQTTFVARLLDNDASPPFSVTKGDDTTSVRKAVWWRVQVPEASGNLDWYIDGTLTASQPLTSAHREVLYSPGALTRGTHQIRVSYNPIDTNETAREVSSSLQVGDPEECP